MKYIICLAILLFIFAGLFAQAGKKPGIYGKLFDSASAQPMADASVVLMNASDSSIAAHTVTLKDGSFTINFQQAGTYILDISFQGYATYDSIITIPASDNSIQLGSIMLAA